MPRVFVAVGSNIHPLPNVRQALLLLSREAAITGVSTFYRTAPLGSPDAARFVNGVIELSTDRPPRDLKFRLLRKIEEVLGRRRGPDKNAPRPIDLDLLLYGEESIRSDGLNLPDPEITERPFLAVPLCELAPDLVMPGSGRTMREIARLFVPHRMERLQRFSDALRRELLG